MSKTIDIESLAQAFITTFPKKISTKLHRNYADDMMLSQILEKTQAK